MITDASLTRARNRAGITLTEILIAILILAVGLASLATLFPLGLLRLREAARSTRSAYLMESAAADVVSRGLLTSSSFMVADQFNYNNALTAWFTTTAPNGSQTYNPLTQDTPGYYQDWFTPATALAPQITLGAQSGASGGYGLPFAYDPLWRFQTFSKSTGQTGYYMGDTFEARFGAGLGFIQNDPDGGVPSAHGLQRLTNFNRPFIVNAAGALVPIMPVSSTVPSIFVSPEDVVWVENVTTDASSAAFTSGLNAFSPVLPDLSLPAGATSITTTPVTTNTPATPVVNDWHYSWMFTGQQNNTGSSSTFDGNIVIFENRPFAIEVPELIPNAPTGAFANTAYQVEGETVVEAIWGYSANVAPVAGPGYGTSADRAVLLRWYATEPDPVVRVGDWIADVTYERQQNVVYNPATATGRFMNGGPPGLGVPNPFNNNEWDNLPAQRCFWYRVQKAGTPAVDSSSTTFRSMVVYVDRTLQARTLLKATGQPAITNAALISPYVVNVIPQTIFTR